MDSIVIRFNRSQEAEMAEMILNAVGIEVLRLPLGCVLAMNGRDEVDVRLALSPWFFVWLSLEDTLAAFPKNDAGAAQHPWE